MSLHSPAKSSRLIKATPFFYGWVILVAGTIGSIMMGPSQTFTVSIFLDKFIADLDISRSTMSLIYGLATLGASLMLPITGRLVDRYGARRLILGVAFLLGLASLAMSQVRGVATILIGILALRFLGFGSMQLVSNNIIAQWFIRRRGFVMGLSGLSLSISLMLFPSLAELLINLYTWRGAWVILGLFIWVVMLPLGWFFFKDRPEQYGLLPDGDRPVLNGLDRGQSTFEQNWTLSQARRTGVFWLFLVAFATMATILAGLVFHQLSLFQGRGLSRESAIWAFQTMALFSVIGNLIMGRLIDRFSARLLLTILLWLSASTVILIQVMVTPGHAFVLGLLMGLISGAFRVMDSTVWAKYFGRLHLGSIKGTTLIGIIGGTALGPYLLGFSFDNLGGYGPALTGLFILPLVISLLSFFIKRPEEGNSVKIK